MKLNPGSLPLIFLMFVMLIAVSTVTVTAVAGRHRTQPEQGHGLCDH